MMSELAQTATRLREVREAHRLFLTLWALDEIASKPQLLERVARDINRSQPARSTEPFDAIPDVLSRDWSLLYRGSILDD